LIACFIACVAVSATIAQGNRTASRSTNARAMSVLGWLLASIAGLLVWAFVCAALMGFGFSHSSSLGLSGIFANILLFAGPAAYLWTGYRIIETVNARRSQRSDSPE